MADGMSLAGLVRTATVRVVASRSRRTRRALEPRSLNRAFAGTPSVGYADGDILSATKLDEQEQL
jgi:hypothetical protein